MAARRTTSTSTVCTPRRGSCTARVLKSQDTPPHPCGNHVAACSIQRARSLHAAGVPISAGLGRHGWRRKASATAGEPHGSGDWVGAAGGCLSRSTASEFSLHPRTTRWAPARRRGQPPGRGSAAGVGKGVRKAAGAEGTSLPAAPEGGSVAERAAPGDPAARQGLQREQERAQGELGGVSRRFRDLQKQIAHLASRFLVDLAVASGCALIGGEWLMGLKRREKVAGT
jgi:hypothetical protein